jgi:DNA-binding response OmpR family regulator
MTTLTDTSRRSVLIVEDDPEIAQMMRQLLEDSGLEVAAVEDGELALAWMATHRADIVVTGGMLPRIDGFELTRRITGRPDAPPVVFFTAKGLESDRRMALEAGAVDYISKVDEFDQLVPRVRAVLDSRNT